MHKKYTNQQVKDFTHDREVRKFHDGEISDRRIRELTEIEKDFKEPIKILQLLSQRKVYEYNKKNINVEILMDNWMMKIQAYNQANKNQNWISEEYKRIERYLLYRYNHKI